MRIVESLQLTGTDQWYEQLCTWKYFYHDKIPLDGVTEKAKAYLSIMDLSKKMHFKDATTVFHMVIYVHGIHADFYKEPIKLPYVNIPQYHEIRDCLQKSSINEAKQ